MPLPESILSITNLFPEIKDGVTELRTQMDFVVDKVRKINGTE